MDKQKQTWQPRATTRESKSQIWADGYCEIANRKPRFAVCNKPWFSLAHKHKHKHMCIASENWVNIQHKHKHKKNGQVRSSCTCAYAYVVALTSENWVDISISRGLIIGHFDPDLMRTYQKQYGEQSVRHLVYHQVEESWYRELSQICYSARAYVLMLMLMRW